MHHISSLQNPQIKRVALLGAKAKERRDQGLFVAEGLREVGLALQNGFEAISLLFDESATPAKLVEGLLAKAARPVAEVVSVTAPVFEKIAYRTGVANVVGVFKMKKSTLHDLVLPAVPLLLIVENVEKPGNLGAMLRTADAAGVNAVIVCDPQVEPFNPNAVRASLGAAFTVPMVEASAGDTLNWLKTNQVRVLSTWLEAAKPLYACDLAQAAAIVVGAEATGISRFWVDHADERIIIPMQGQVDSLNVSTSAAVVLFEAVRQRLATN